MKKDGGVVIIDHASFAHGPVLMRFKCDLSLDRGKALITEFGDKSKRRRFFISADWQAAN